MYRTEHFYSEHKPNIVCVHMPPATTPTSWYASNIRISTPNIEFFTGVDRRIKLRCLVLLVLEWNQHCIHILCDL